MRCLFAQNRLDHAACPQILQEVSFTHNVQSNASTGISPNQIVYGSRLRTRVDAVIPLMETNVYPDMDVYFREYDEIGAMRESDNTTDIALDRKKSITTKE